MVQVSGKEVEFKTVYKRHALKEAVIEEVYPPSITVKAVHSKVPEHLRCPRLIHLLVSGTKSGRLTFPVEVSEEKECEFVSHVCGTCSYEDVLVKDAPSNLQYVACQASMYVVWHAVYCAGGAWCLPVLSHSLLDLLFGVCR